MGCCCSCLKGDGSSASTMESEMTLRKKAEGKAMMISKVMSAPSIEIESSLKIGGNGLALAAVSIEQDAAYWEWHVEIPSGDSTDIMFGVATKKDAKFYKSLEEADGDGKIGFPGFSLFKFTINQQTNSLTLTCKNPHKQTEQR